jgi:hypothetical protein
MRAEGKSEEQIERALAFINAVHAAALRGDNYASVERQLLAPARGEPWYGYLSVDDEEDWGGISRFVTERYEPTEALARVHCPFLALFGALDVLVPAWKCAAIYSQSLRAAGNRDATIVVFPQGNHRILLAEAGEFVPGYLDLLGDWAARRIVGRGRWTASHDGPQIPALWCGKNPSTRSAASQSRCRASLRSQNSVASAAAWAARVAIAYSTIWKQPRMRLSDTIAAYRSRVPSTSRGNGDR